VLTITWASAPPFFQAASIYKIQKTREGMEKKW
jgi:hypothetical protein